MQITIEYLHRARALAQDVFASDAPKAVREEAACFLADTDAIAKAAAEPAIEPRRVVKVAQPSPTGYQSLKGAFGEVVKVIDGNVTWPVLVKITAIPAENKTNFQRGEELFFAHDELEAA